MDEVLGRTLEAAPRLDGRRRGARSGSRRATGCRPWPPAGSRPTGPRRSPGRRTGRRPGRSRSPTATARRGRGAGGADPHAALAVPLEESGSRIGYLAVYSRDSATALRRRRRRASSRSSPLRATPAIENARRFREARQLADLDALTGLHNRRYFHETLARECARAHRYNRRLALIVFDLDDFKVVNDRIGHLAGDAVLAEAAERVREVIRTADIPCRVGGDEFAVILPESGIEQAEQLFGRLQATIGGRPIGQAGTAPHLRRRRRAEARRRLDHLLRARRRGALPREGRRQGRRASTADGGPADAPDATPSQAGLQSPSPARNGRYDVRSTALGCGRSSARRSRC